MDVGGLENARGGGKAKRAWKGVSTSSAEEVIRRGPGTKRLTEESLSLGLCKAPITTAFPSPEGTTKLGDLPCVENLRIMPRVKLPEVGVLY